MADLIGIGLTHFPGLAMIDQEMTYFFRNSLERGAVPERFRDPADWPEPMRQEWGQDQGSSSAAEHRRRCLDAIRKLRSEIDAFRPDAVLIFGDDQYENFVEDIVPPFCIFILDEITSKPYLGEPHLFKHGNIWGDAPDRVFVHKGHSRAARHLATALSEMGIDVPYAYRLRHTAGLGHAFINTLLFLDYDRRGFDYSIIPFHVNCYGGELVRRKGGELAPGENAGAVPDPPAPTARACFDLGRAIARVLTDSEFRVAVVASSSWSHAFLTAKNHWLYPDHESDRSRLAELEAAAYWKWRDLQRDAIEAAGQQEMLNWVCLAGAMSEIGASSHVIDYVESYVFNSNKCFALFRIPAQRDSARAPAASQT